MSATPQNGTIVMTAGPKSGAVLQSETYSNTDVVGAYATWYSNGTLTFVIAKHNCFISDISEVDGIADTTQLQLYINGTDVNVRLLESGILTSVNNRLPHAIGPIKAGSMIQLKELA